jgi:Holliday junction resolvase
MKKRESKLWLRIKNLKLKGQIFRIESNTINGIPDIYYLKNSKSIWIELKSNQDKNLGLSKYQINWHIDQLQDLSQKLLKLFKSNETRVVELVASGEDTEATLILFFDKMTWRGS